MSLEKIEKLNKIKVELELENNRLLKRLEEQEDQLFKRENVTPFFEKIVEGTRQRLDEIVTRIKENEIALIETTEVLRLQLHANDRKDGILERQARNYEKQEGNYENQDGNYKKQTGNNKEQKEGVHEKLVVQTALSARKRMTTWESATETWNRFVVAFQQTSDDFYNASLMPWENCQDATDFVTTELSSAFSAKIPLAKDVFQQYSAEFAILEDEVDVLDSTLIKMKEEIPGHTLCIISELMASYFGEIKKMRRDLVKGGQLPESRVQHFYVPLYDLLTEIMKHVVQKGDGNRVTCHQMKTIRSKSSISQCYIKPEKKVDFAITAPFKNIRDGIVLACMELKKSEAEKALDQLILALGGPLWHDYLFHGVKFFFASTADAEACTFHLMHNKDGHIAAPEVCTMESEGMGVNTVYKFLLCIMYNYTALYRNMEQKSLYTLITYRCRMKDRPYWIVTQKNQVAKPRSAIRVFGCCNPYMEKSVPKRKDHALHTESMNSGNNWCPFLARAVEYAGDSHTIVQQTENDVVRRYVPVGLSPAVVVEHIDHIRIMSDQVLQALKFLHSMKFVHGAPLLQNVVRTSDCEFALVALDEAQKISSDKKMKEKAFADIKIFIQTVLMACDHAIRSMANQIVVDTNTVKKMDNEDDENRQRLKRRILSFRKAVVDLEARKLLLPSFIAELQDAVRKSKEPFTAEDVDFVEPALFKSRLVQNKKQEVFLKDLQLKVDGMQTERDVIDAKDFLLDLLSKKGSEADIASSAFIHKAWSDFGKEVLPSSSRDVNHGLQVLPSSSRDVDRISQVLPSSSRDVNHKLQVLPSSSRDVDRISQVLPSSSRDANHELQASSGSKTVAAFASYSSTSSQAGHSSPVLKKRAREYTVNGQKKRNCAFIGPAKKVPAKEIEKEVDAYADTDKTRVKEIGEKEKERKRKMQEKAAIAEEKKEKERRMQEEAAIMEEKKKEKARKTQKKAAKVGEKKKPNREANKTAASVSEGEVKEKMVAMKVMKAKKASKPMKRKVKQVMKVKVTQIKVATVSSNKRKRS